MEVEISASQYKARAQPLPHDVSDHSERTKLLQGKPSDIVFVAFYQALLLDDRTVGPRSRMLSL